MRSRCSRSIITMSAFCRPSRMSRVTSTPSRSTCAGSSVDGATTRTRAPECVQQIDVRARHARMQNVAADRDDQALDRSLVAADGQRIEQRLGRMLMRAVAGIDHRAVHLLRQQFHRAGSVMPDHQDVGMHGVQRHRGIDQRLALLHGGRVDRHIHDVGAEPLAGQFERGLRPGRGFEEQIDLGAAAQRRALLLDLAIEIDEFLGEIEESV